MTEKKKVETVPEETLHLDGPLSQLLLSVTHDKYRMISLATRWAQEIRVRDQSILPPQELLAQSLREILGKKVTLEAIEKLPPPPKAEKKDPEFTLPTLSLKEETVPAEKPAA
jgi:DNA-directed RNA polymerase subunit K/omega